MFKLKKITAVLTAIILCLIPAQASLASEFTYPAYSVENALLEQVIRGEVPNSIEGEYDGFIFKLKDEAYSEPSIVDSFITKLSGDEIIESTAVAENVDGIYELQYSDGIFVSESGEALQKSVVENFIDPDSIEYIIPNFTLYLSDTEKTFTFPNVADNVYDGAELSSYNNPDDPLYQEQWNLPKLEIPYAWTNGFEGQAVAEPTESITVAVLDSGLNEHIDLDNDQILWDLAANYTSNTPSFGKSAVTDINGHGTSVSGIIAASKDNSEGISGIAPLVKILPIKVTDGSKFSLDNVLEAIPYAMAKGADVINMSWGMRSINTQGYVDPLKPLCDQASASGVLLLAAAGNDGNKTDASAWIQLGIENVPQIPAAYDNVIGVASTTQDDKLSAFSQKNASSVDVAAPGSVINGLNLNNGYKILNGTSFAAPEVSALAAMMKSIKPSINHSEFFEILKNTSHDLNDPHNYDGYGIVDFKAAIEKLVYEQTDESGGMSAANLSKSLNKVSKLSFLISDTHGNKIASQQLKLSIAPIEAEFPENRDITSDAGGTYSELLSSDNESSVIGTQYKYRINCSGYMEAVGTFKPLLTSCSVKVELKDDNSITSEHVYLKPVVLNSSNENISNAIIETINSELEENNIIQPINNAAEIGLNPISAAEFIGSYPIDVPGTYKIKVSAEGYYPSETTVIADSANYNPLKGSVKLLPITLTAIPKPPSGGGGGSSGGGGGSSGGGGGGSALPTEPAAPIEKPADKPPVATTNDEILQNSNNTDIIPAHTLFSDIKSDDWYDSPISYVVSKGYFKGVSEKTFAPEQSMTRAMFVTVLGRMSGINTSDYKRSAFKDIAAGSWYEPYVAWAASNGIVKGNSSSTFAPNATITREEIAAVLFRYAASSHITFESNKLNINTFSDSNSISYWASDAMKWAVNAGMMQGASNKLNPSSPATRAQVAKILQAFDEKAVKNT